MSELNLYNKWLECATDDPDLKNELLSIKDNEEAVKDSFYRDLEFGTGGLRGVIGAGTNRMNVYTVRRATQGLANYLKKTTENASVAISYDSRIKSDYFAKSAAEVLAANGINVHIYTELMPTPMLSYAVRALKCDAGIMVTASHNPAKYNGYKVYGSDGCQMTLVAAEMVLNEINKLDVFSDDVKHIDFEKGVSDNLIKYINSDVIDSYFECVLKQGINTELVSESNLKVVYTPLNGTGNKPVRRILKDIGVKDVTIVKEQENPDGNFTTCPYPNPEIKEALEVGLKLCDEVKPDLLLATDPDCDRVGIAVPDGDHYELFSGNEVGAMLFEYICSQRIAKGTMPKNPIVVKTIVTTDIVAAIAKKYNVELIDVLTGFKFIGEQIGFLEEKGEEDRYVFGFEESYGYLAGSYVRDKDAVVASMLICEMAAYYRTNGISLIQARENLYKEYGVYIHSQHSFTFEGEAGMKKMAAIMEDFRSNVPQSISSLKVLSVDDYKTSESTEIATGSKTTIKLPKSNVIAFNLEKGAKVVIRPSGTEPLVRVMIEGKDQELIEKEAKELAQLIQNVML
jgi:phosphoglucomutase